MKRDITKALAAYYEKFEKRANNEGAFYPSDVIQIIDRNKDSGSDAIYKAITDALKIGFIIGARYQYRQGRKRKNCAR